MSKYREITSCVLCKSPAAGATVLFQLNQKQRLLCCRQCGLVFNDYCRVDHESIYNDAYYETTQKTSPGGYFAYDRMEKAIQKTYRFSSLFIAERCKRTSEKICLLDIGCGYGFFLKQFKGTPNINLFGVELSHKAADEASRFIGNIYRESAEFIDFSQQFDIVVSFELIEHLLDPPSFLKKVHHFLKDDGYFFITSPDVGSLWFKLLGKRWPGIHPDYHNVYFSKATIRKMAEECGFEVVKIRKKQYFYTNICHIRRRLKELFPLIGPVLGLLRPFDSLTVPFLHGGDLQVVLRKKVRASYEYPDYI